jgi:hypothetical protein
MNPCVWALASVYWPTMAPPGLMPEGTLLSGGKLKPSARIRSLSSLETTTDRLCAGQSRWDVQG